MLSRQTLTGSLAIAALAAAVTVGESRQTRSPQNAVPRWGVFEAQFTGSANATADPVQDVSLRVTFTAPSGTTRTVDGFYDGGHTWRVRFSPGEVGEWRYRTHTTPATQTGLHEQSGVFRVTATRGQSRFDRHGPVRVAASRTHLEHADGTPFFWLADTGWNAALLSTPGDWSTYVAGRAKQRFTAIQWVATEWRAAPDGDLLKERAYTGQDRIEINVPFFQLLDRKAVALNEAGLLNVPVMLWAINSGSNPKINPGVSLPEDQAIQLARYMVARWHAYDVAWILAGDGDYRGERADKWKRIGRGVFDSPDHAPVIMHPGGMHWILKEFQHESWVDILGYQSGHGDDEKTLRWMTEGPPSRDWTVEPIRPFINLEPPYEDHIAYQSKQRISSHTVRRAVYWSLLNAPTAGVTYGGHGIWGWDDGTKPPTDHPHTGVPQPWQKAMLLPGAREMTHVATLFESIDFRRLKPAPDLLVEQPGREAASRFIAVAASETRDLIVAYTPEAAAITLKSEIPSGTRVTWYDPRTGRSSPARSLTREGALTFQTPGQGDWLLVAKSHGVDFD